MQRILPEPWRPRYNPSVVAIPASNEADRIKACLAALAVQRDLYGEPISTGGFEILVFANNCTDGTASAVERFATDSPHPIVIIEEALPPRRSNAGWARKRAMDLASARLHGDGVLLTTDADSCVSPTWFASNLAEMDHGVDCVAGYIDADPVEITGLGSRFLRRGRLEDHYLRLVAEIVARCDPRPHDPWPNHRVTSGASLAVRRAAFEAVGGIPAIALGEDAAFVKALECGGFLVRHSLAVTVTTSCRLDGRATGGAADTMKLRRTVEESPCDDDLRPALSIAHRALLRGALRRSHRLGILASPPWPRRFDMAPDQWSALIAETQDNSFALLWAKLEAESPVLKARQPLRPSDLPHQIGRADMILCRLRGSRVDVPSGAGRDHGRTPDLEGAVA